MNRQAQSPFRYLFILFAAAQSQFNFGQHYLNFTFQSEPPKCPDLHVYVVGLSPYTCVSYRSECQGVTYVQMKLAEGQQILCHPNFQPNLRNPFIFKNFSVDPYQSITLRIDEYDQTKFQYTNDIQLKNCYIVYASKNSLNQGEGNHCLFYRKQFIVPYPPYEFGVLEFGLGVSNDEVVHRCNSGNIACWFCNTPDFTACDVCLYNECGSENRDGRLYKNGAKLSKCTPGYGYDPTKNGYYSDVDNYPCIKCYCATCYWADRCAECDVKINFKPPRVYLIKQTNINQQQECNSIKDCVQYLDDFSKGIKCIRCNFGTYQDIYSRCMNCNDPDNILYNGNPFFSNCLHCSQSQCFVCLGGYHLEYGSCIKDQPCALICQTCLNNNLIMCTSCNIGGILIANQYQCICDESIQYYEVDANCLHCKKGICEICLSFNECLQCKTETFRYLDGTKCFCKDGYYDNGDLNYICGVCHPTCLTCFGGDAASCLTCKESQNRNIVKGFCLCKEGFGQNKNNATDLVCKQCYARCETCEYQNDPFSCTSCLDTQNRQLNQSQQCFCIDTYGDNQGALDACYICHFSCQYCNGPLDSNCLLCSDSNHRKLSSIFKCECIEGYFEVGKAECQRCHYSCVACQDDSNKDQCTKCPSTRQPGSEDSVFVCLCKDSNYFDDGISQECQQCHYSCLTCSFYGPSFCITCDLSIRKFKSSNCKCLEKTFDDEISTCLPCHPSCLTCQGTESTDCLTCSPDMEFRQLLGGACICQEGYFEDNGASICQQCSYRCKSCDVSKDLCLTCPLNSLRELGNDSSCSCSAGFFDDPITLTCIVCHLNCLTCFGSEINQCKSCKPLANREFKNNQCICKSRYFELNVEQCSSCSQECLECSLQFDSCTSCQKGKQLIGNKCYCETKLNGATFSTYKPSGSIDCIRCHYSCLLCNDSSYDKCLTCYGIENRYQSGSTCLCLDGYYDPGASICQKCGYQCQTCIYSENQCLSCQQNSFRTLSAQIFSCSCNQGYFDDGQNPICQKCDYRCGLCSIRFDHCMSCLEGTQRYFNEILFTCDCIAGFYDGGDAKCKPCHYSCLECTGQENTQCRSCDSTNPLSKRVLFYTKCVCLKGYYDDGVSANCEQCDVSCLECETQAYSCISCSTTRTLNNNSCKCKSGYFETGQKECLICSNNCLQCKTTAKTCTECNTALFLALNTVTNSCICQFGYMQINGLCQMCTRPCQACSLSLDNCTSCLADRYLSNNQCLCLDGFYDSQGQCLICHKSCLTCKNNEYFCLTCSAQNFRKLTIQNTCECLEGYYEQITTLSCEKCDFSCKTCTFKAKNCTSCHTTLHFDIYLNTCLCQQGYYLDQVTYTCLQCHISCLTCDSLNKCSSCRVKTRTLDDQLKTCDCQEGFFETNQPDCLKCNYSCLTCSISENNCQSCNPILHRNLIGNKCYCVDGYYDAGTQLCFACGSKCKTCIDKLNKCTLCYETQNRSLKANICECQDGYFDSGDENCQKCSTKCKTCTGSADYCTSCDINLQRFDQSVIHKCPCYIGFYENEIGQCQKCNIKCESCINTRENCLSCNNPQKNNRLSLSNQCNCKNGFYDDNSQLECQKCSKICLTCITNATNCISCFGNLRYNPPNCTCLDGYYEDADQNCLQCQNQCETCIQSENNCLICKHGRINQACECPEGYFEAGQTDCIKCEFQCLECIQYSTQCTTCRGNRVNPNSCICEDGYYDDSLNDDCQQCDFRCKTCNIQGCLTCNGNRILSNVQTCDPPDNSISYETTPWCSNCEVAVLLIRFQDDLNSILVKFDFQLKALLEIQYCNQIFEDETLNKIGIGYSCNIDQLDNSILIISLGQQSTIIVDDQIKFKLNILQHIDCQMKIQNFVFLTIQVPQNILEPVITFTVPNYQISSCNENIITSDYTDIDGKRRFSQIKWSYKILNQENRKEIDDLIHNFNTNQDTDIVIPAQSLPESAQITFQIQIKNFIGTTSTTTFDLNTLSPSQPIIAVDFKSTYFNYQTIIINYSINLFDCNNKNAVQSQKVLINLVEINKSNKTATSTNINLSFYSEESQHSVSIPKYQLTPKTTYYFKLNATDVQTLQSSEIFFNFLIKPADLLCQFFDVLNVQDYRKDLNFYIQCKDSNSNYDWNSDPFLEIEVTCNDLTTQGPCINQQKKKLVISQYSYEQAVPKYSVKPYTVQSWQVLAKKEDSKKSFEQIVVFIEDSFAPLEILHNPAYNVRAVNNYEQLNFTYQIPLDQKVNVVEMSLSIICDFSVIKILQPKYYQFQMQLQNYINDAQKGISQYNLKFSVQYSTNITPSIYNLPLTLNIPPICSKFKQIQSNVDIEGVTKIDIVSYCSKSNDSPYQYKVGYFLTEQDQIDFLNGNSMLILGSQVYQKSPKLSAILPNSFYNNSIFILVSVMDSGGSIANQFDKSKIEKKLNCSQQNISKTSSLNILIPTLFQALGQLNCSSFQYQIYQQILMKGDLSNEDFIFQKKAIRIYKIRSKQQQKQLRILGEQIFNLCIDPASQNYIINYTSNNNINLTLDEVIKDSKSFEKTLTLLTKLYNQSKADLKNQDLEWDQNLFDEYIDAIQSLKFSLFDADNILVKLSFLNGIDEQGYQILNSLLLKIDLITKLVQDQVVVNESPEILDGEILHWKLQRQTKQRFNEMIGQHTTQDDQIIKFIQKEYIELNLSPYKFTNSMKQTISNLLNSTNFLLDPTKMIQTKLYIFHFNDQYILQMNSSSKLQYQMKQLQNCSNDSSNTETKHYSPVCYVIQGNQIVENCIVKVHYQQQHANLNCICSSFGQVILLYKEIQLNSSSINENTTVTTEEKFTFSFENISFQSLIVIFLIAYNCLTIAIYLYLIHSNKQPFDRRPLEQNIDKIDEQISLFPGNVQVLKQSFKFIHQLSSMFCFNDSIIQKSFYFIDMNVQFFIMLLPLFFFNIDLGSYYIEILIVVLIGMIFRMVSKILQGFYRLNNFLRITIEIMEIILFSGTSFLLIILQANLTEEQIISKIFDFFIGIIVYEVIIEPLLIISSVQSYKMAYSSIKFKEFKSLNHLIYYFAFHESLEEIFKQFTYI